MDEAIEQAYRNKVSLYFSFEAGPRTPGWVYEKGVPKVVTDNERHADKFPHYPYYLSPVYKTYYHRFLTAVAQHIRGYAKDRQERIAFIQVKTGCTGDETPYKGRALKPEYELVKNSAAWRAFPAGDLRAVCETLRPRRGSRKSACCSGASTATVRTRVKARTRKNGNG